MMNTIDYYNDLLIVGGTTQDSNLNSIASTGSPMPAVALYNLKTATTDEYVWFKSYSINQGANQMQHMMFNPEGTLIYTYIQGDTSQYFLLINTTTGIATSLYEL